LLAAETAVRLDCSVRCNPGIETLAGGSRQMRAKVLSHLIE